ncbi:probable nucleoside diphosphate kinase 5 [Solanum dulcamara]|uniref:probable nucleoside diphosphate kinase 5 n=1 Tax=Solanum dulcamara TaxID=45834 RepID=UPI002485F0E9|nr:probable nucleoside diphosphate kinase 5 [Solanum dulcamara]
MTPQFIPIILFPFFLVCTLSLLNRCSADSYTERTLAIIKPDGVSGNHTNSVKETILNHGFRITEESFIQLDKDRVKSFYAEHSSRSFFPCLVEYMTSGPVLIMVLEKENAVADWRALIGPTDPLKAKVTHPHSVRAICGLNLQKNCVHGSDSPLSAIREISFFFKTTSSGYASKHDEL